MADREVAYKVDVDKIRFLNRSNQEKVMLLGNFVEDTFEDAGGIDAGPSSNYIYDSVEGVVEPSGGMATVVSDQIVFSKNVTTEVVLLCAGEGTIRAFFSRDDGSTWTQLTDGVAGTISGSIGNKVRLKVEIDLGGKLKGWAAHWA